MRRLVIPTLALFFTAISPGIAVSQPIVEIKKSVFSILESATGDRDTADLSVKFVSAGESTVRVGSDISLAFASNQSCFVTIFWVESGGDINMIKAWNYEERLTPDGKPRIFPDQALGALEATPPLGWDTIYAFCTRHKPIFTRVLFTQDHAGVSVKDAIRQIPKFLHDLSSSGEIIASAKTSLKIIGRENSVFSEKDIIETFRGPSRSSITRSVLAAPVQFNVNSDRIIDSAFEMLNNIGSALTSAELGQSKFRINGHTDSTGTDAYNDDLSERRASSVKSYLVTHFNIEPSRLEVVGWGEHMAISDNSTDEGQAENRRVEFELLDE